MAHYIGDPVPLTATFTDPDTGLPADPSPAPVFVVQRELDASSNVTAASSTVGTWTGTYVAAAAGLHQVRVAPTGAQVKVLQDQFWVEASNIADV